MSADEPSSVTDFIWALPDGTPLSDNTIPFISLDEPPTQLLRAVVPVIARIDDDTIAGLGTAFCVGFVNGTCALFVAASHVVEDLVKRGGNGFIALPGMYEGDRAQHFRGYQIVKTTMFERTNHIALMAVRIENQAMSPLAFRINVNRPAIGDHYAAYGYSLMEPGAPLDDLDNQLWKFDINSSRGDVEDVLPRFRDQRVDFPAIQIGARVPFGMSGGPLIDRQGTAIGVMCDEIDVDAEFSPYGYAALMGAITELRLELPIDTASVVDMRADQMAANGWIESAGGACRLARYGDQGIELFWLPYPPGSGPSL